MLGKVALKIGFVDRPTQRKTHDRPIPMLAGIGIFLAFFITYLFFYRGDLTLKHYVICAAAFLILAVGMVDDWFKTRSKEFSAFPRLIVYAVSASLVYFAGCRFTGMNLFWMGGYVVFPEIVQYLLTVTWILGLTVVVNWMDGIDGLAGGISCISAVTFFVISIVKGQADSAMMSVVLACAILGYLKYNLPPAKVYMADSGATFIGFMLAVISLEGAFKQVTMVTVLIPLLAVFVPVFDNLRVIVVRMKKGKKIYAADKEQIHHKLVSRGMDVRQVDKLLFLSSGCFSVLSLILLMLNL